MKKNLWKDDAVQFPRLLAEIAATLEITAEQWDSLAESMDLEPEEIGELFDRAQAAWERLKLRHCPPNRNP